MHRRFLVASFAALAGPLAGCVAELQQVDEARIAVTDAGSSLGLASRAADCRIDFFRTKTPERAYDEVAALHYTLAQGTDPAAAQEDLRRKACELGADAVVVTRDFLAGGWSGPPASMTVIALSYRDTRERHRAERAQREAAREVAERKHAEERQRRADELERKHGARPAGVPADYVPVLVVRPAIVRPAPGRVGFGLGQLAPGELVWVSPTATKGHRQVFARGVNGFVEVSEIELPEAPGATPAPSAAPAPPPPAAGRSGA